MLFHICIPSYNRPKIINEKSLAFLKKMGIDQKMVEVIVETNEMKADYLNINPNLNIIVSNTNGIKEKRNFVRNYYRNETNITNLLCLDDDLDDIMDFDKSIEPERFIEIVNEENYSEGELNLIYKSMYEDIDEEYFDETYMEENGWDLSDTTYEITGGVEFTLLV